MNAKSLIDESQKVLQDMKPELDKSLEESDRKYKEIIKSEAYKNLIEKSHENLKDYIL